MKNPTHTTMQGYGEPRAGSGFTLVELIIYIGILAIILIAIVNFSFVILNTESRYNLLSAQHEAVGRILNTVDFLVRNSDGFVKDSSGNNCIATSTLLLYFATSSVDYVPHGCMGHYASGAVGIEIGGTTGIESNAGSQYNDIVVDSSHMYLGGKDQLGWRIEKRRLSDLSLDYNFDYDGIIRAVTSDVNATVQALAVDSTYLYAVGPSTNGGTWRIEKRYLSNGALVASFGTNGVVLESGGHTPYGIAVDDTSIYIVGDHTTNDWRIEKRSKTTGALDTGFDGDGVTSSPGASTVAYDIVIDGAYMYVVGGWTQTVCCFSTQDGWRIEKRLLSTGAFDTSFNSPNGYIVSSANGPGTAYAVTADSSHVYVTGNTDAFNWQTFKYSVTDGVEDGTFSVTHASASNIAYDIVIDASHAYIVGDDSGSDLRIEKRLLTTGALDSSFGTSGVVTGASDSGTASAVDVAGEHVYTAGRDGQGLRVEKRMTASGNLAESRQGVRLVCYQDYPNNGQADSCSSEPPNDSKFSFELFDASFLFSGPTDLHFSTTTLGSREAIETTLNIGYIAGGLLFTPATVTASSTSAFRIIP